MRIGVCAGLIHPERHERYRIATFRCRKRKQGEKWKGVDRVTQADVTLAPLGKVGPRELEFRQA